MIINTRLSLVFTNTREMRHVLNHIVWILDRYNKTMMMVSVVKIKSANCAYYNNTM